MTSIAPPATTPVGPPHTVLDRLGAALLGLTAGWTAVSALDRPSADPWPVLGLVAAIAVLFLVGRLSASRGPALPGAVAVGICGAIVFSFPGLLHANGAPTGYANSNASLAALGAVSAAAASATHSGRRRQAWSVLALALSASVVAAGSVAASLSLAAAAALVLAAVLTREVALAVIGGAVAATLVLGITGAIAAGGDPLELGADRTLRTELWGRALDVLREEPARGVGAGAYTNPPSRRRDADLRWAHHGYLQQGAEQGAVGLVLLLSLVGWTYLRLWEGRCRPRASTLAGAAALTVVALHASVDHVLHTPAVPLTLAVLLGWATASRGVSDRLATAPRSRRQLGPGTPR